MNKVCLLLLNIFIISSLLPMLHVVHPMKKSFHYSPAASLLPCLFSNRGRPVAGIERTHNAKNLGWHKMGIPLRSATPNRLCPVLLALPRVERETWACALYKNRSLAETIEHLSDSHVAINRMADTLEQQMRVSLCKKFRDALHITFCHNIDAAHSYATTIVRVQQAVNEKYRWGGLLPGKMIALNLAHIALIHLKERSGRPARLCGFHSDACHTVATYSPIKVTCVGTYPQNELELYAVTLALGELHKSACSSMFPHSWDLGTIATKIIASACAADRTVVLQRGGMTQVVGSAPPGIKIMMYVLDATGHIMTAFPIISEIVESAEAYKNAKKTLPSIMA